MFLTDKHDILLKIDVIQILYPRVRKDFMTSNEVAADYDIEIRASSTSSDNTRMNGWHDTKRPARQGEQAASLRPLRISGGKKVVRHKTKEECTDKGKK